MKLTFLEFMYLAFNDGFERGGLYDRGFVFFSFQFLDWDSLSPIEYKVCDMLRDDVFPIAGYGND